MVQMKGHNISVYAEVTNIIAISRALHCCTKKDLSAYRIAHLTSPCPSHKSLNVKLIHRLKLLCPSHKNLNAKLLHFAKAEARVVL